MSPAQGKPTARRRLPKAENDAGRAYNESMGKAELRILKTVIEFVCPWCRQVLTVRMGRGPHRCPSCQAVFTDLTLHIALASTIYPAEA